MNHKRQILIVDDHPLFREGLKATIGRFDAFEVIGEAGRSREALRLALELKPHLMLVDISLPDGSGIELARQIGRMLPQTLVVIISVHSAVNYIAESFQAGVMGYLTKDSVPETLLQALEAVSEGKHYLEGPVSADSIKQLINLATQSSQSSEVASNHLTHREHEVLRLMVKGRSCNQIAEALCISLKTVYNHRTHIMEKLSLRSPYDLYRCALAFDTVDDNSLQ
jgi:DNA-binding NarL/FixJ family response regulator